MVDRRRRLHHELIEAPPADMENAPATFIDYSTHIEQMGAHRAPVRLFAPRSRSARQYRALYRDIRPTA